MSKLKKALQRATESRGEQNFSTQTKSNGIHPLLKKHGIKVEVDSGKEIKVTYSRTRIEHVDHKILRKNKILSLFKKNQITDQVDILRTQLLSKLEKNRGNSLLVTSCNPGEGKTFTSINLGVSIAQQLDRTVLIIDTDLRHPWKYHYNFATDFWGLKAEKGLSDYLLGNAEIEELLINPGIDKLTIIPGGKPLPNSAEVLGSQRMVEFVTEVKSRYGSNRICIFDSPALMRYADPLVFTHLIDGILLVVEAEHTKPDEIKKVLELLEGRPVLGTVFNKSREKYNNEYV